MNLIGLMSGVDMGMNTQSIKGGEPLVDTQFSTLVASLLNASQGQEVSVNAEGLSAEQNEQVIDILKQIVALLEGNSEMSGEQQENQEISDEVLSVMAGLYHFLISQNADYTQKSSENYTDVISAMGNNADKNSMIAEKIIEAIISTQKGENYVFQTDNTGYDDILSLLTGKAVDNNQMLSNAIGQAQMTSLSQVEKEAVQLIADFVVSEPNAENLTGKTDVIAKLQALINELEQGVKVGGEIKASLNETSADTTSVVSSFEAQMALSTTAKKMSAYTQNDSTDKNQLEINEIALNSSIANPSVTASAVSEKAVASPEVQVAEFISNEVDISGDFKIKELTLKLNPEHLGEIDVKITKELGEIVVRIVAQSEQTARLFEKGAQSLLLNLQMKTPEVREVVVQASTETNTFYGSDTSSHQSFSSSSSNNNNDTSSSKYSDGAKVSEASQEADKEQVVLKREGELWQTA